MNFLGLHKFLSLKKIHDVSAILAAVIKTHSLTHLKLLWWCHYHWLWHSLKLKGLLLDNLRHRHHHSLLLVRLAIDWVSSIHLIHLLHWWRWTIYNLLTTLVLVERFLLAIGHSCPAVVRVTISTLILIVGHHSISSLLALHLAH